MAENYMDKEKEARLPQALPATISNSDPAWVDKNGIAAMPGIDFLSLNASGTLHVATRSDSYLSSALCGVGGPSSLQIVEYLRRPSDGPRTWTVCLRCRKLWARGER